MYCKKYRCEMEDAACFIRRKNAMVPTGLGEAFIPGKGDVGCAHCKQGAAIAGWMDPAKAAAYSAGLRANKSKAIRQAAAAIKTQRRKNEDFMASIMLGMERRRVREGLVLGGAV